jgi:hypothetical protein
LGEPPFSIFAWFSKLEPKSDRRLEAAGRADGAVKRAQRTGTQSPLETTMGK